MNLKVRSLSTLSLICMLVLQITTLGISYLDNTELVVDSKGLVYKSDNVGINIEAPLHQLHVSGDVHVLGHFGFTEVTVANDAIDWTKGNKQRIEIDGDTTITFSNDPESSANLILLMKYISPVAIADTVSLTSSKIEWPGTITPVFSKEEDHVDIISFYYSEVDDTYYGTGTMGYEL